MKRKPESPLSAGVLAGKGGRTQLTPGGFRLRALSSILFSIVEIGVNVNIRLDRMGPGHGVHSLIAKHEVNQLAGRLFTESMFSASKQATANW